MLATQINREELANMNSDTTRVLENILAEVQRRDETDEKFAAVPIRLQSQDGAYIAGRLDQGQVDDYLVRHGFTVNVEPDDPDQVGHNTHALYILEW